MEVERFDDLLFLLLDRFEELQDGIADVLASLIVPIGLVAVHLLHVTFLLRPFLKVVILNRG